MVKKKFRFPWFYLIMVLYAVVFLLLTKQGLTWFWGYIEAYELSQPEYAIEAYMEQLSAEDLYAGSEALISQLDSNLQSREQCYALIDGAVSQGITYAKNTRESSMEQNVYMLLSNGKTIGKVITEPGAADEYGFRRWSATEEAFDFSFLMGTGTSITVPHDHAVSANGVALDESYIVETGIHYAALEDYYEEFEGLPYMVTYQTPAIWGSQALLVTDPEGKIVTIDASTDMECFLDNCSEEELQKIEKFAQEYIDQYMTFISCSNEARRQQYNLLIDYIVDDTPLEERMYDAMDGLQWVTKQNAKLVSMQVNDCISMGEGRYLCDLTYVSSTTKYTGATEDVTNAKLILVMSGSKLLVESMQNY